MRADALSQIAEQIQRAVGGDVVDTQALEAQLQALQGSSGIGQIVQSEAMAVAWLNAITAAIHARLDRRPVCYQGQATPDARVLQAIFASVYVGQVQPWLAQVQKAAQAARPPAQNMLALLADDLGAAMQAYRTVVVETGPGSSQAVFLAATQAHAKAWQRLLAQCGMMPTR